MATKKEIDVRDKIVDHLKVNERSLNWLHEKTGIPYSTLYFILYKKERSLTEVNKGIINKTLNTSF
jgi:predicted transcriptional regulator